MKPSANLLNQNLNQNLIRNARCHGALRGRSRRGFTLIEILVVVVIIAILAAVVVPSVIGRIADAKFGAALSDIKSLDDTIDQYQLDTGSLPPSLDALITNPGDPKWHGPYLKGQSTTPVDQWGHPYIYKVPGDNGRPYDVSSAGDGTRSVNSWDMKGTGAK